MSGTRSTWYLSLFDGGGRVVIGGTTAHMLAGRGGSMYGMELRIITSLCNVL